jgi:hypothetical protein
MNKILFLVFVTTLLFGSCDKNKTKSYHYRVIGTIYNKNDSTPFSNTKFKVYLRPSSFNATDAKESYFFTDVSGHFDFTSEHKGSLVWPSYHTGASYVGPPEFGNSGTFYTDEVNKIYVTTMDTIYTTPYY